MYSLIGGHVGRATGTAAPRCVLRRPSPSDGPGRYLRRVNPRGAMAGFVVIAGCASIASGARDVPTTSDASVDASPFIDAAADIRTT